MVRAVRRSAFKIQVCLMGGLNDRQKRAFKRAANRWSRVIIGDMPSVEVDGETIDDVQRYDLPDLLALAERGDLVPHKAPIDRGRMLPIIPTVLPTSALR